MYKTLLFIFFPFLIFSQTILGIDVSHHQGNINWNLVKNDGKIFAYCKASEGMTYHDPNFITYMTNGANAGIIMGAYHFARPDNNTAVQDATNFINQSQAYIGGGFLPPALDLEDPNSSTHLDQLFTSTQLTNWVQTWMNTVENQTGIHPIIYLSSHYANFLKSSLNIYGLWIAKPNTTANTPPNDIGNWNNWQFKQYSWIGNVNGIAGNVDLNSFNGTITDFNALIQTLGVAKFQKKNIKLFPNPVKNILHYQLISNVNLAKIDIYDLTGRFIISDMQNNNKINLTKLSAGLYLVRFYLKDGSIWNFRVFKK